MLYQGILITLVALSCIGVLHTSFSDNLLQRTGLCCIALGSAAEVTAPGMNPRLLLVVGLLIYAVGVLIKVWWSSVKKEIQHVDH